MGGEFERGLDAFTRAVALKNESVDIVFNNAAISLEDARSSGVRPCLSAAPDQSDPVRP